MKLKLFCETPSGRTNTKVSDAFFVRNRDVGDPLHRDFLISGEGSLMALEFSIASDTSYYRTKVKSSLPIGSREALTMRMYWPLPESLTAKQQGVNRGAFVDMIGNYEATTAERIFQLAHGELTIDSVKSKKLYLSIDATFRSLAGDSLRFDGNVRVRERKQFKFSNTSYHLKDR
ncbi:hypothetical protein JYT16_02265 [Gemmatimonas aurantiaca]|nr:hypothetical protein [Gemmatimonas aurantiaca]